jgi:hypothetical protein
VISSRRRLVVSMIATVAGAFALPALAEASTGVLSGSLGGQAASDQFGVVSAVNAQGVIEAMGTTTGQGGFTLRLPPGVYVVIGDAATAKGAVLDATGAPVRVRAGRRVREHPKLGKDKYAKGRPAETNVGASPFAADLARPIAHADDGPIVESRPLPHNAVVSALPMPLGYRIPEPGFEEGPDRAGLVLNHFFAQCAPKGVRFVDTSPEFVKFAQQESAMQKAGTLSKSTPFSFHPIRPTYQLNGLMDIDANDGNHTPELTIDLELEKLPVTQAGATLGEAEGETQASMGEPLDDSFVTSTLLSYTDLLAAQACPG